jgi:L-threonylcarbamoyladenylate synthase
LSAEILRVHPDEPQPDRIDYIVSCLRKGDVIALPTDTFYGLAVDPVNLNAVEQIYKIKTRQRHKPLSLLISGLSQAYELARDTDPQLDKLADRFWPGPLTIIVRAGTKLPLRSTANTGNVALRVPDAAIPRAVVERFGLPITATSANLQGAAECTHAAAVRDQRRRADGPRAADHNCGPLTGARALGNFARRRDSNTRNRHGAAALGIFQRDRQIPGIR